MCVSAACCSAVLPPDVSCGGASGSVGMRAPTDFTLALSASSVNVSQGGTSSPGNISVAGRNGFSSSVQVSFGELPDGVTTNPASPFPIVAGQTASVTLTDMNTLVLTTPALAAGPQQLVQSNPDGESATLDAAFLMQ
jgi:hypothetical protein